MVSLLGLKRQRLVAINKNSSMTVRNNSSMNAQDGEGYSPNKGSNNMTRQHSQQNGNENIKKLRLQRKNTNTLKETPRNHAHPQVKNSSPNLYGATNKSNESRKESTFAETT